MNIPAAITILCFLAALLLFLAVTAVLSFLRARGYEVPDFPTMGIMQRARTYQKLFNETFPTLRSPWKQEDEQLEELARLTKELREKD